MMSIWHIKVKETKNRKTNSPSIHPAIGLLGLSGESKTDPSVLLNLMMANEIDLALEGGGLVPAGGKSIPLRSLQIGRQLVGGDDHCLHQILAIDWLEVTTI